MEFKNTDSKCLDIAVQFFQGAVFGFVLVLIPCLNYEFFVSEINTIQIVASAIFIIICGTLSATWCNKVLNILLKMLESNPF